jgi:ankyrin repeat protein
MTPIMWAAMGGHVKAMQLLIDAKADTKAKNKVCVQVNLDRASLACSHRYRSIIKGYFLDRWLQL